MARTAARAAAVSGLCALLAVALTACGAGGDGPTDPAPREEPGPTLATAPRPADWRDVRSATGLVYSVPPDWEVGDPFGEAPAEPGADPAPGADPGTDWGSGFVTTANAIADRGYCPTADHSFRVLSGVTDELPGQARDQAESASRAIADSIDRRFTQAGADVPLPEPRKIGVSGSAAWHVSLRGQVRPPRDRCTPPVIRFDAVAVSTRTPDGAPASIVFVLMADEGEPGVQPEATVDAVVASLRYDNMV